MVDLACECRDGRGGDSDCRQASQADDTEFERQRAEFVTPGRWILLDQSDAREAHEIGMRLGGRHAGLARQIAQHHRLAAARQSVQQFAADFDRLNTATVLAHALPNLFVTD
jgi:hypothetical protein